MSFQKVQIKERANIRNTKTMLVIMYGWGIGSGRSLKKKKTKKPRVSSHAMLRSLGFILYFMLYPLSKLNLEKGTLEFWQDHSYNSVKIYYRRKELKDYSNNVRGHNEGLTKAGNEDK